MLNQYLAPILVAVIAVIFGFFMKYSFVSKKNLYSSDGQPHFRFRKDCETLHRDLHADLDKIHGEIQELSKSVGRIEGKLNGGIARNQMRS